MVKTTLYLDEILDREIKRIAKSQGRSKHEVIREALTAYTQRITSLAPLGIAAFRSGRSDVAERAEDLLWVEETPGR